MLALLIACWRPALGQGSGTALSFDGNDWINFSLLSNINNSQALTFACWVYPSGSTQNQTLFTQWQNYPVSAGTPTGVYFTIAGAKVTANMVSGEGVSTATDPLQPNHWNHIAVVFDGTQPVSNDRIAIYVNGVLQPLDFTYQFSPIPDRIGNISSIAQIGGRRDNSNGLIDFLASGTRLDEMCLYNRALPLAEIRHRMCQKLTGTEPGLVPYYRMDEGTDNTCPGGQDVCDTSGNGHHGIKF
jgi:hypothetical protein